MNIGFFLSIEVITFFRLLIRWIALVDFQKLNHFLGETPFNHDAFSFVYLIRSFACLFMRDIDLHCPCLPLYLGNAGLVQ